MTLAARLAETGTFALLLALCLVFAFGDVAESRPTGAVAAFITRSLLLGTLGFAALALVLRLVAGTVPDRQRSDGERGRGDLRAQLHAAAGLPPTSRDLGMAHLALLAAMAAWLGVLGLSAWLAPAFAAEAQRFIGWPTLGVLLSLAVFYLTPTAGRWVSVGAALGVGAGVVAALGLAQAGDLGRIPLWLANLQEGSVPVGDVPRITSALSHPNVLAIVLEVTLPLVLAATLTLAAPWRWAFLTLLALNIVALVLTFSRAGLVAVGAALALFAAVAFARRARHVAASVAVAIVALPLVTVGAASVMRLEIGYRLLAEVDPSTYRAAYIPPPEITAAPGQTVEVPVRVTNLGTAPLLADGSGRVALGYHLLLPDGTTLEFDSATSPLPHDLPPANSADVLARLQAPERQGTYVVQWDMLREGIAWFSWRGTPTAATHLTVDPAVAPALVDQDEAVAAAPITLKIPRPVRVQLWTAALAMLRDYALLGVGPDNFHRLFANYSGVSVANAGTHAHSLYLEALADTGLFGFLTLMGILAAAVYLGARRLLAPHASREVWIWRTALLASLAAWLIHGVLDDFLRFFPAGIAFWVIVGLIARGATLARDGYCRSRSVEISASGESPLHTKASIPA